MKNKINNTHARNNITPLGNKQADPVLTLTNEERMQIPKLGVKSVGFHEKCQTYMASNPEFLPGFIDIAEINKDKALVTQLMQFHPQLTAAFEAVDDTVMILNSELFMADLAYYQTVREAAKRGRPGAETIYTDLRQRFPGANAEATPPPPTP